MQKKSNKKDQKSITKPVKLIEEESRKKKRTYKYIRTIDSDTMKI